LQDCSVEMKSFAIRIATQGKVTYGMLCASSPIGHDGFSALSPFELSNAGKLLNFF
jgi:hypothetical protein